MPDLNMVCHPAALNSSNSPNTTGKRKLGDPSAAGGQTPVSIQKSPLCKWLRSGSRKRRIELNEEEARSHMKALNCSTSSDTLASSPLHENFTISQIFVSSEGCTTPVQGFTSSTKQAMRKRMSLRLRGQKSSNASIMRSWRSPMPHSSSSSTEQVQAAVPSSVANPTAPPNNVLKSSDSLNQAGLSTDVQPRKSTKSEKESGLMQNENDPELKRFPATPFLSKVQQSTTSQVFSSLNVSPSPAPQKTVSAECKENNLSFADENAQSLPSKPLKNSKPSRAYALSDLTRTCLSFSNVLESSGPAQMPSLMYVASSGASLSKRRPTTGEEMSLPLTGSTSAKPLQTTAVAGRQDSSLHASKIKVEALDAAEAVSSPATQASKPSPVPAPAQLEVEEQPDVGLFNCDLDVEMLGVLGEGTDGEVHAVSIRGRKVALKRLKNQDFSDSCSGQRRKSAVELHYLRRVRHMKGFVQCVGACDGIDHVCIALERLDYRLSQYQRLKVGQNKPFPSTEATYIIRQVCEGMQILHKQIGIAHGDLAFRNILVQEAKGSSPGQIPYIIKLCDFGRVKRLSDSPKYSSFGSEDFNFYSNVDVGYFGREILYRAITGHTFPASAVKERNYSQDVRDYVVYAMPNDSETMLGKYYHLCRRCVSDGVRPTFAEILEKLDTPEVFADTYNPLISTEPASAPVSKPRASNATLNSNTNALAIPGSLLSPLPASVSGVAASREQALKRSTHRESLPYFAKGFVPTLPSKNSRRATRMVNLASAGATGAQ